MIKEKRKSNKRRTVITIIVIITSPIWLYFSWLLINFFIIFIGIIMHKISEPFARKYSKSVAESKKLGVFIKALNYKVDGIDSSIKYELFIEKGYKRSFWNKDKVMIEHDIENPYNLVNTFRADFKKKNGREVSINFHEYCDTCGSNQRDYYEKGTFWGEDQLTIPTPKLIDTIFYELVPYYQNDTEKTSIKVWDSK